MWFFKADQYWWYIFYGSFSFSKQNSSRKIDLACVDSITVQAHYKLFQYLKIRLRYLWSRASCWWKTVFKSRRYLSKFFQDSKNNFLPFPLDEDGVSQSLKAWKNNYPLHTGGPIVLLISWTKINLFSRGRLPKNWKSFLRCDENKKVFSLLASTAIVNVQSNRILVATCNEDVQCNHNLDLVELKPCIHEKADQKLCLHAKHDSKSCNLLSFWYGKHRPGCHCNVRFSTTSKTIKLVLKL